VIGLLSGVFGLRGKLHMLEHQIRPAMVLLLCLWLCSTGAGTDLDQKPVKPDLQSLRAAIAKRPCKVLAIVEPVEIKEVFYWKDGGSIGLELKDAKGTVHRFALDGRAKKSRCLFLGVNYPSETSGKRVDVWGVEEQELYSLLLRWVNRHPQWDALFDGSKKLDESKQRLWEFREFFLRMDDRFRQMNGLPRGGQ
jgi:hypothetical protein